ncbi:hypothetical protein BaRGS_00008457 [Batillaria attramentaria]|uniref:Uncharacterized protein n=1 Tax=Batillaria attramentaria TaxID=370345 RepID=A0ABD0LL46_9CAEN
MEALNKVDGLPDGIDDLVFFSRWDSFFAFFFKCLPLSFFKLHAPSRVSTVNGPDSTHGSITKDPSTNKERKLDVGPLPAHCLLTKFCSFIFFTRFTL